jgi:multidrug efflux pump subunit AcrA (membrane-fusion protein)
MRKIDRRIIIVGAFVFIVVLAYGLMRFLIAQREDPMRRPPREAKRFVNAEPVKYGRIISPVSADGRLTSVAEVEIIAEASGKIQAGEVRLKKGAEFSKGDVLFTVYPDEAILALKARKSQFLNILANLLPDIRIDFPEYEETYMRFFSSIDIDRQLPEFPSQDDEKLKIFLTSRNVLSEYYNIRKDELQLQRRTVRAPFNGTFTQVNLEVGSYTNTGGRVATAIQTDDLELEVPVASFDAAWINIGDPVKITSSNIDHTWMGKVVRKSPFVDPATQSQGIFVQVKNHKTPVLLPGEYYRADFPGHPIERAMEIPRNTVFNSNEVFTIVENRLKKRLINVIKENQTTLIFDGLQEGELLVLQPLINVLEGTMVEQLDSGPPAGRQGQAMRQQRQPGQPGNPTGQGKAGKGKPDQGAAGKDNPDTGDRRPEDPGSN